MKGAVSIPTYFQIIKLNEPEGKLISIIPTKNMIEVHHISFPYRYEYFFLQLFSIIHRIG